MLGFPIHYCKGMRPMMFQLSGFYCTKVQTGFLQGCFIKGFLYREMLKNVEVL